MSGRLIGASLGPGDPGLITRKAWARLTTATCWAYPISSPGHPGYARAIADRAGLTPPGRVLELHFPMVRHQALLATHWEAASREVLAILHQGEDVVFLVEGDASSYATFGHLARTVVMMDESIQVEVIPGVSSPQAVAARTGLALAENEDALAVVPATRGMEVVEKLLQQCQTVALLKVRPVLEQVLDLLERLDLLDRTVFVERAGAPDERVVRDVRQLRGTDVHYLSLMLIRR